MFGRQMTFAAIVATLAAVAAPAALAAESPATTTTADAATTTTAASRCIPALGFAAGTVAAVEDAAIVIDVKRTGPLGKGLVGSEMTVDVMARTRILKAGAKATLADVAVGDRVVVRVLNCRGQKLSAEGLKAAQVVDLGTGATADAKLAQESTADTEPDAATVAAIGRPTLPKAPRAGGEGQGSGQQGGAKQRGGANQQGGTQRPGGQRPGGQQGGAQRPGGANQQGGAQRPGGANQQGGAQRPGGPQGGGQRPGGANQQGGGQRPGGQQGGGQRPGGQQGGGQRPGGQRPGQAVSAPAGS